MAEYEIPAEWLREEALGPREVGKIFDVDPRTVVKWAGEGMIGFYRTPSRLRRFPMCEVKRVVAGKPPEDPQMLIELARQDKEKYRELWHTVRGRSSSPEAEVGE